MRFYPSDDVDFYVDVSDGWDRHCSFYPTQNWRRPNAHLINSEVTTINYWRDIEGAKKPQIKIKDLYFPKWNANRLRPGACLPLLYAMGDRYIKLQKAYPAGFKCSPLPLSLGEVKEIKRKLTAQAKALKAWQKSIKGGHNISGNKKAKKSLKCKRPLKNKKERGKK